MSLIVNDLDRFVKYKYAITEFYIILNGVSQQFPIEKINGFRIENYFEDASFPIFKVNLVMEPSRYFEIIQNKDNVKFKMIRMLITRKNKRKKLAQIKTVETSKIIRTL